MYSPTPGGGGALLTKCTTIPSTPKKEKERERERGWESKAKENVVYSVDKEVDQFRNNLSVCCAVG